MKTWKIPVSWESSAVVKIKANSLSEAIEIASEGDSIEFEESPYEECYVDGSWRLSIDDEDIIRMVYNYGQIDDVEFMES